MGKLDRTSRNDVPIYDIEMRKLEDEMQKEQHTVLNEQRVNNSSVWTDTIIESHYEGDKQVYMMPVTAEVGPAQDSVAFVKLGSSTILWICDWSVCRAKEKPVAPDVVLNDPYWVLLDECYDARNLAMITDGQNVLYRLSGTYVYGYSRPNSLSRMSDIVAFPRPPWMNETGDRRMPQSNFEKNLSEAPGNPGR